jgi:2-haloacid dehalogenase
MPLVVFDALGTLFDLEPARQKLVEIGAPAAALEAWFERLLHTALALTTVGEFRPFAEIAEATLQTTLAQLDLDESSTADVVACLESLDAYDDAALALERLGAAGVRIVTSPTAAASKQRRCSSGQACSNISSASSASRRFAPTSPTRGRIATCSIGSKSPQAMRP